MASSARTRRLLSLGLLLAAFAAGAGAPRASAHDSGAPDDGSQDDVLMDYGPAPGPDVPDPTAKNIRDSLETDTRAGPFNPMLMAPPPKPALETISGDQRDRELSVNTRTDPELDPAGVQAGAFTVYPLITAGSTYVSNVYYSSSNAVKDLLTTVAPDVKIVSNFVRHALALDVHAERGMYADTTSENYTNYGADMAGRLDIGANTSIPLMLNYDENSARRPEPEDRFGIRPTTFLAKGASSGLNYSGDLWEGTVYSGYSTNTYSNTPTLGGFIVNKDRDRDEWLTDVTAGILPEGYVTPFLYTTEKYVNYVQPAIDGEYNRDAMDIEGGIGTKFSLSNVTQSSLRLGYVTRHTHDPRFSDVKALTYNASVTWEPSTLAAFTLDGYRTIGETALYDFSSSIDTSLSLSMKYELTPSLILLPSAGYLDRSYHGLSGGEIQQWTYGGNLTYKLNNYIWATATATHTDQNAVVPSPSLGGYTDNVIGLKITFQR